MKTKEIALSMPNIQGNELKYVTEAIKSTWVSTKGKFVKKFSLKIAEYVKAKYAIACQNGTSGLHIGLLLSGIKPGDEVIVPTLTFIAPVNVVKYVNAEPVFMDCDEYMNIDVEKMGDFFKKECKMTIKGLKNKTSGKIIKAIIPVHIFGNPCQMEGLLKLSKKYKIKVIEDATESLGTFFSKGNFKNKFTGTLGEIGVYSFNGNKIITTGGGGMLVTNNFKLAKKAEYLTTQAKDDDVCNIHNEIGYNFRMTNLQAAFGLAQLEKIEEFIKVKKSNFKYYQKELDQMQGLQLLNIPDSVRPNYWFYSLIIEKKKFGLSNLELMKKLKINKIQSRPIWYLNHWQKPYKNNQSYKIEKAIWFWQRVLNIPCSSNLKNKDVQYVIKIIQNLQK